MRYPREWNNVKVGMSRQLMIRNIGESLTNENYNFKGDVYINEILIGWYRMDLSTDTLDTIRSKHIQLYIGTKTDYFKINCIETD